jgi:hypothetical protein
VTKTYDEAICWAFSKTGQRCELEAGHEGDHSVSFTWTDAEAWQPTMVEMTKTQKPVPVLGYPDLPTEKPVFPCGACDWPDPETHDSNPYGCRTFV